MAFNFNWSPLSGDPEFYQRAQELLTDAMNKNPKPPIIVDDILVSELNVGDIPPELEIVEISDIGVDRFRGTFKMAYKGNAFITIKTRVQANPLNTYLLTRPVFASPQPLAAQTGLNIPIQITLSDFRLSAIIILVFSRQKGLTIVFRNDPLESLKVSSTFDSIPFLANYLQKEIERQIRMLLMDHLPAIIHRLSLRLWTPEHQEKEDRDLTGQEVPEDEPVVDPLASPPQDPVDSTGAVLTPAEIASLSLDSTLETQSLFSRKNLLRLATLTDSHRTLSLFTPSITDVVFRAWTGPLERGEMSALHSKANPPALSRKNSTAGSLSTTYTFDSQASARPSLQSYGSTSTVYTLGASGLRHGKSNRKRKKRVVNLRKQSDTGEMETVIEDGSTITDSASVTESSSTAPSVFSAPPGTLSSGAYRETGIDTPPRSPEALRRVLGASSDIGSPLHDDPPDHQFDSAEIRMGKRTDADRTIRAKQRRVVSLNTDLESTPRASTSANDRKRTSAMSNTNIFHESYLPHASSPLTSSASSPPEPAYTHTHTHINTHADPHQPPPHSTSTAPSSQTLPNFLSFLTDPSNGGSIAEKAWMLKMANEMARRYEEERQKGSFEYAGSSGFSSRNHSFVKLSSGPNSPEHEHEHVGTHGGGGGRNINTDAPPAYT